MIAWYIFYTYPKAEKSLYKVLSSSGYEVFLPLQEQVRQWHDRKKKVVVPIFPNYIFVKTDSRSIYEVLKFPRIISYVKCNNKPSRINEDEIQLIRTLEKNCSDIKISSTLSKGRRTRIEGGPLDGLEGIVEENTSGKRIVINIDSIAYSLRVSLVPDAIME